LGFCHQISCRNLYALFLLCAPSSLSNTLDQASLVGNDYLSDDMLAPFWSSLDPSLCATSSPRHALFAAIADVLNERGHLAPAQVFPSDEALQDLFVQSLERYRPQFDPFAVISADDNRLLSLSVFGSNYLSCRTGSSRLLSTLLLGRFLTPYVMGVSLTPAIHDALRTLRATTFACLHLACGGPIVISDAFYDTLSGRQQISEFVVSAQFAMDLRLVLLPTAEYPADTSCLVSFRTPADASLAVFRALDFTLSQLPQSSPIFADASGFSASLAKSNPTLAICLWCLKYVWDSKLVPHSSEASLAVRCFAAALLLQQFLPARARTCKRPETAEHMMLSLLGSFTLTLEHALLLNDALGSPISPDIRDILSGIFTHNVLFTTLRHPSRSPECLLVPELLPTFSAFVCAILGPQRKYPSLAPTKPVQTSTVPSSSSNKTVLESPPHPAVTELQFDSVLPLDQLWMQRPQQSTDVDIVRFTDHPLLSSMFPSTCPWRAVIAPSPLLRPPWVDPHLPLHDISRGLGFTVSSVGSDPSSSTDRNRLAEATAGITSLRGAIVLPPVPQPDFSVLPHSTPGTVVFEAFQQRAFEMLVRGVSVVVSAPTGSGKTEVAMFALELVLRRSLTHRALYVCPTKALCNQLYGDISARFVRQHPAGAPPIVGILTGDSQIQPNAQIIVTVPEILLSLLIHSNDDSLTALHTVVVDEMHCLGEDDRGPVWEEMLLLLPQHTVLVGLSATIGEPQQFISWLRAHRTNPIEYISDTHRRVPQSFFVFDSVLRELPASLLHRPSLVSPKSPDGRMNSLSNPLAQAVNGSTADSDGVSASLWWERLASASALLVPTTDKTIQRLFTQATSVSDADLERFLAVECKEISEDTEVNPTAAFDWVSWKQAMGASVQFQREEGFLACVNALVSSEVQVSFGELREAIHGIFEAAESLLAFAFLQLGFFRLADALTTRFVPGTTEFVSFTDDWYWPSVIDAATDDSACGLAALVAALSYCESAANPVVDPEQPPSREAAEPRETSLMNPDDQLSPREHEHMDGGVPEMDGCIQLCESSGETVSGNCASSDESLCVQTNSGLRTPSPETCNLDDDQMNSASDTSSSLDGEATSPLPEAEEIDPSHRPVDSASVDIAALTVSDTLPRTDDAETEKESALDSAPTSSATAENVGDLSISEPDASDSVVSDDSEDQPQSQQTTEATKGDALEQSEGASSLPSSKEMTGLCVDLQAVWSAWLTSVPLSDPQPLERVRVAFFNCKKKDAQVFADAWEAFLPSFLDTAHTRAARLLVLVRTLELCLSRSSSLSTFPNLAVDSLLALLTGPFVGDVEDFTAAWASLSDGGSSCAKSALIVRWVFLIHSAVLGQDCPLLPLMIEDPSARRPLEALLDRPLCNALAALKDRLQVLCRRSDVSSVMIASIRALDSSVLLSQHRSAAVWSLAYACPEMDLTCIDADDIAVLVEALERHPKCPSVFLKLLATAPGSELKRRLLLCAARSAEVLTRVAWKKSSVDMSIAQPEFTSLARRTVDAAWSTEPTFSLHETAVSLELRDCSALNPVPVVASVYAKGKAEDLYGILLRLMADRKWAWLDKSWPQIFGADATNAVMKTLGIMRPLSAKVQTGAPFLIKVVPAIVRSVLSALDRVRLVGKVSQDPEAVPAVRDMLISLLQENTLPDSFRQSIQYTFRTFLVAHASNVQLSSRSSPFSAAMNVIKQLFASRESDPELLWKVIPTKKSGDRSVWAMLSLAFEWWQLESKPATAAFDSTEFATVLQECFDSPEPQMAVRLMCSFLDSALRREIPTVACTDKETMSIVIRRALSGLREMGIAHAQLTASSVQGFKGTRFLAPNLAVAQLAHWLSQYGEVGKRLLLHLLASTQKDKSRHSQRNREIASHGSGHVDDPQTQCAAAGVGNMLMDAACSRVAFDPATAIQLPTSLCMAVLQKGLAPAIIFCPNRRDCEVVASALGSVMNRLGFPLFPDRQEGSGAEPAPWEKACLDGAARVLGSSLADLRNTLQEMSEETQKKQWTDEEQAFLPLLLCGIGIHHAGMSAQWRMHVESLFRRRRLLFVTATSTLALGIHMPCRTVIVFGEARHFQLTASRVRQMSGRAGRRGFDPHGTVVFTGNLSWPRVRHLVTAPPEPLKGYLWVRPTVLAHALYLHERFRSRRAANTLRFPFFACRTAGGSAERAHADERLRSSQIALSTLMLWGLGAIRKDRNRLSCTPRLSALVEMLPTDPMNMFFMYLVLSGGLRDALAEVSSEPSEGGRDGGQQASPGSARVKDSSRSSPAGATGRNRAERVRLVMTILSTIHTEISVREKTAQAAEVIDSAAMVSKDVFGDNVDANAFEQQIWDVFSPPKSSLALPPLPQAVVDAVNKYNLYVLQCMDMLLKHAEDPASSGTQATASVAESRNVIRAFPWGPGGVPASANEPSNRVMTLDSQTLLRQEERVGALLDMQTHRPTDDVSAALRFSGASQKESKLAGTNDSQAFKQWEAVIKALLGLELAQLPFASPRTFNAQKSAFMVALVLGEADLQSVQLEYGVSEADVRMNMTQTARFLHRTMTALGHLASARDRLFYAKTYHALLDTCWDMERALRRARFASPFTLQAYSNCLNDMRSRASPQ
jgi:hypothetical protein